MALKLNKAVRRITQVHLAPSSTAATSSIIPTSSAVAPSTAPYTRKYYTAKRKRKGSKAFTHEERLVRRVVASVRDGAVTYLKQHSRSNRKRRDGWIRDYRKNDAKARKKMLDRLIP